MSVEESKMLLGRFAEEFNRGNDAYLDEYFGPGYVYHSEQGDLDAAGFKVFRSVMRAAFSDARMTLDDLVAEGDRVVSRWTVRATHGGEFQGIAPTGKQVTITGFAISRIEDGRAVEEWGLLDTMGLMQQLGAIPVPAET